MPEFDERLTFLICFSKKTVLKASENNLKVADLPEKIRNGKSSQAWFYAFNL